MKREVSRGGSDDDVVVNDDDPPLTHYAFRVSRTTELKLQKALRNIVSHYFNDHTGTSFKGADYFLKSSYMSRDFIPSV